MSSIQHKTAKPSCFAADGNKANEMCLEPLASILLLLEIEGVTGSPGQPHSAMTIGEQQSRHSYLQCFYCNHAGQKAPVQSHSIYSRNDTIDTNFLLADPETSESYLRYNVLETAAGDHLPSVDELATIQQTAK
jgi:hypothetical protein